MEHSRLLPLCLLFTCRYRPHQGFLRWGRLAAAFLTSFVSAAEPPALKPVQAITAVRDRMARTLSLADIADLAPGSIEALLTPAEHAALASCYLRFHLDRPARLYVFRDRRLASVNEPFWLTDTGFEPTLLTTRAYQQTFEAWRKDVPSGEIGLGVHALRRYREHYFVVVAPQPGEPVPTVTPLGDFAPGLSSFEEGSRPWVDRNVFLETVPAELVGSPLIQPHSGQRSLASAYDYFRITTDPATAQADQIIVTPGANPASEVGLSWRTDTSVTTPALQLRPADPANQPWSTVIAASRTIKAPRTLNQSQVQRHAVALGDLLPDTRYTYRAGTAPNGPWSKSRSFRTAPATPREVTFLMFGDVQEKFEVFAALLSSALAHCPDPDFIVFAGDLVSRGNDTDDWDAFFAVLDAAKLPAFIVPAIGNHELLPDNTARLYRAIFVLPENGPVELESERAYTFEYAGLRLVVLDSNTEGGQTAWLETQLRAARTPPTAPAIAIAHHGAYTSRPGRYYPLVRERWAPLFESRHVPLVLQGHDHAYLRTHPQGRQGTTYLIATAGGKFYPQAEHAYSARAFADTPTFQVITVSPHKGSIDLVTYAQDGTLLDTAKLPPAMLSP